jgi:hypothetical protein
MAIAEHKPEELYPANKGILGMSKDSLHDFASTKEAKLPEKVKGPAKVAGPKPPAPDKDSNKARLSQTKALLFPAKFKKD